MVKNYILAGGFAVISAGAVAHAQSTTPQQPTQTQPAAQTQAANTTIEGCVYREADIPGRTPNVAERQGVLEDYILVASPSGRAQGAVGTTGTAGTTGATGTSATTATKMFKLEHADDDKLRALVGKRVTVVGKADVESGDMTKSPTTTPRTTNPPTSQPTTPQADRSVGPDKIELPEFEVSTITEAAGTCPTTPDIKK